MKTIRNKIEINISDYRKLMKCINIGVFLFFQKAHHLMYDAMFHYLILEKMADKEHCDMFICVDTHRQK